MTSLGQPAQSHESARRPVVAVSMGDPFGIGPEVLIKALADKTLRRSARFVIFGTSEVLLTTAAALGVEPFWWRVRRGSGLLDTTSVHDVVLVDCTDALAESGVSLEPARNGDKPGPTRAGGAASLMFVEDAISAAKGEGELRADAIVTAPVAKEAWALSGEKRFPGHTELLTTRFGAKRTRMMFVAPKLNVMLATTHIPLAQVSNTLTIGRVFDTIELGAIACRQLGINQPRIAVCGVNPHASEGGMFGHEEEAVIEPAIRMAQQSGIDARGPFPGDTVFNAALKGDVDLVVAMYHDQGLVAVKTVAFESAVNVTIGLPVPRTSPDHGTAYDIVGKNIANPGSMRAALKLAVTLARHSLAASGT